MNLQIHGHFIDHKSDFIGTITITKGIITNITKSDSSSTPSIILPYHQLIFPGMIDIHVHAREDETGKQNYKEDYDTCQASAINGGVTSIAVMPNTPSPLTTVPQLEWHQKRCSTLDITICHYIGIGPSTNPLSTKHPYKVYTGPSVGPLFFTDIEILKQTLSNYKNQYVSFHVEDYHVLSQNKDKETHNERRPIQAVENALKYVLEMIEEFNLKAKLCHWTCTGNTIKMIQEHKNKGYKTKIEISPLNLYFNTSLTNTNPELWPYLQMNPSLQSEQDQKELIKFLASGFIDYIASDHAPHALSEKFKNFDNSETKYLNMLTQDKDECIKLSKQDCISGTPQLDTYGLISTWLMKEHNFPPQTIAKITSYNPGKFINKFTNRKYGKLKVGYVGSLTVLDMTNPTIVRRTDIKSKVGWSPFENIEFPGSVSLVIVNGKIVKQ